MMARVGARRLASYMIFGTELSAGHNEKFDFDESVMAVAVETRRASRLTPGSGGVMEAIFQFVDEVVEAQRDTYCAIADDIWDHPETRFEEFWSAQRLADARRRKVFSSPAMLAGSRMPLSPASVRANRSLPCSANLTPRRDSASRPTARNRRP